MAERKLWDGLAAERPYWAVLGEPRYRDGRLEPADIREFFESGERDLARTLTAVREHVAPDFHPEAALDYGCGIGRLTIPIARESGHVVGVDLSDGMLGQARSNAERMGIHNAEFVRADEFLAADDARFTFDFVHSYIVLMHVKPRAGMAITDRILRRLRTGGVGALHYTYARQTSLLRRIVHPLRRPFPPLNVAVNLLQRRPALEPMVPMYEYDLGRLFELLRAHGCGSIHAELTDHGGHRGAMLLFRKTA